MIRAPRDLALDLKRQTGVIDKPLDQAITHRSAGSPDTAWNFRRVAQQADRAFPDHFRGRSIAGIAIATDRDAHLTSVRREADEQKVVQAVFPLRFRRTFARLWSACSAQLRVGGHHP